MTLGNCQKYTAYAMSRAKEFEAFEIKPNALKQMRQICDPITAPF
jgi:hypothetical protein